MKNITREEALELLKEYNKDKFHIKHALTVEGVMKYFAEKLGYGEEKEFWGIVGLLHDLDFEMYPDEHCLKVQEIMREKEIDEKIKQLPDLRGKKEITHEDRIYAENNVLLDKTYNFLKENNKIIVK